MSATIHQALESFCELATHVFLGNDTGGFVQHGRCLLLADQLAARTSALSDEFRRGLLPEVLALRPLGTEGDFRARLLALDEAIHMVVGAAQDTLEAITADNFPRARQRVSEGAYLLWQLNAALEAMRAPGFTPPTSSAAGPISHERRETK